MAKQTIGVGSAANDGTGDTLRNAMIKINQNTDELYTDVAGITGLADNSVTTAKLVDGNVTATKLASNAVTTVKILAANVTATKLASNAVTTAKILDANVTATKLASNSVTTTAIADDQVTEAKLAPAVVAQLGGAPAAPEGTTVLSSGETNATKFLREDGDGTCSWQVPAGAGDVVAANNFSEYSATLTAARAGLGLEIGADVQAYNAALTGTTAAFTTAKDTELTDLRTDVNAAGDVVASNNFSEYSATLTAARAGLGLEIGADVQAYNAALTGTTAAFTTAKDTELTDLRTDLDAAGLLVAEITPTVRASVSTDTTTDADIGVTILMADTHTVALHSVTDAARIGQTITLRLRGATQQTIGAGTATLEGNATLDQHETIVAQLFEVGAGTATVWGLTGGSA